MNVTCFIFFSGISIFLVLLPSPWHWRSRNTGTLIYIGWSLLANIVYFVNAVVWRDNANNGVPVWCDIAIKLQTGLGAGLSGASLCITRRLAKIATSRSLNADNQRRRNDIILDISIGVGIPVIVMISSIVVQPHRFDVIEGLGCTMPVWTALPAIFIIPLWPIVFGIVSSVYGAIAMKAFLQRRLHFNTFLKGSRSGLTTSHYLRLMALALGDLVIALPLAVYFLHGSIQALVPWSSWSDVHSNFSQVRVYRETLLINHPGYATRTFLPRWLAPISALLFFSFFGLSQEACDVYRIWYAVMARRIWPKSNIPADSEGQLPFIPTLGTRIRISDRPRKFDNSVIASDEELENANSAHHPEKDADNQECPHMKYCNVTVRIEKEIV